MVGWSSVAFHYSNASVALHCSTTLNWIFLNAIKRGGVAFHCSITLNWIFLNAVKRGGKVSQPTSLLND
jgi:hypothetical protein